MEKIQKFTVGLWDISGQYRTGTKENKKNSDSDRNSLKVKAFVQNLSNKKNIFFVFLSLENPICL